MLYIYGQIGGCRAYIYIDDFHERRRKIAGCCSESGGYSRILSGTFYVITAANQPVEQHQYASGRLQ